MAKTVTVELTEEEAEQLVIMKHFIGPQVNQRGITYWHLKRLEPVLDRIREARREAGLSEVVFDWETDNG